MLPFTCTWRIVLIQDYDAGDEMFQMDFFANEAFFRPGDTVNSLKKARGQLFRAEDSLLRLSEARNARYFSASQKSAGALG